MSTSKPYLTITSAGLVVGVITVLYAMAYAALMFHGPLAVYFAPGFGMILAGLVVASLVTAGTSTAPSTVSIPHYRIVPLFALFASTVAADMTLSTTEEKFSTVVAGIHIATAVFGLVLLLLGRNKLSGIARYIPTPVIGGFLAGCGWLFLTEGFPVLTGIPKGSMTLRLLLEEAHALRWLPGVAAACGMVILMRMTRNALALPVAFLGIMAGLYGLLQMNGLTLDDAMRQGLLIGAAEGKEVIGWHLAASALNANWQILNNHVGYIFTIVTVSVAAFLQSATKLELDPYHEMNSDRELGSTGMVNIVSAFAGGIVSFHSLSLSDITVRLGIRSRAVSIIAALVAATALAAGAAILPYVPYALAGGLLLYFGLSFLIEWLYDSWFRLPVIDYLTILLIFGTIVFFGYVVGVAVGTVMALVLFAIQYSRVNVVRANFTGIQVRSNVDRSAEAEGILADLGRTIVVLKLDGYLFFGTANDIHEAIRRRFTEGNRPRVDYVILDFSKVDGLDSTAIVAFVKMVRFSRQEHFHLLFAGLDPATERQLRMNEILSAQPDSPRQFDDLDHALEWCENDILQRVRVEEKTEGDICSQLHTFFSGAINPGDLVKFLHRVELAQGDVVIREGSAANDIYFLESGTLSVEIQRGHGKAHRVRRMRPGSVVGEVAFFTHGTRSASVIAAEPCVVYRLDQDSVSRMQEKNPALAIRFNEQMASILADRLQAANAALRAAID